MKRENDEDAMTLIKEFLGLPAVTMPSASSMDKTSELGGNEWTLIRRFNGFSVYGEPIRLRADVDGWRNGKMIVV